MKKAKISFQAIKSSGEVVRDMYVEVGPFEENSRLHLGFMSLERMCLEYARVCGVSCSYVWITDIGPLEEVGTDNV